MIYRKKDIECILNRIDKVIDKNNFEFANAGFLEGNLGYCLYYNRQIKKFPTEKQNVSLKHILT